MGFPHEQSMPLIATEIALGVIGAVVGFMLVSRLVVTRQRSVR